MRGAFKAKYLAALTALNEQGRDAWETTLRPFFSYDVQWHGAHPINHLNGLDALVSDFWRPLLTALPDIERHDDIALDGGFKGGDWVATTGHYTGTFLEPWLGIEPTGGVLNVRYGEFSRIDGDKIVEVYCIVDVLDVLRQAGAWPANLPNTRGPFPFAFHERVPAPASRDGLILEPGREGDLAASEKSLKLVEAMIAGLMQYDGKSLESMSMERFWHDKMMWYGPAGIGTSRRLKGFQDVHQRDFLRAFPDRKGGNHKCRVGQDNYVASAGWPSINATHLGPWMGIAPSDKPITMRVMDFWRRDGDKLRENWVFIDQVDLLKQMGLDVMSQLSDITPKPMRAK